MGNRLFNVIVIVFWFMTMSWLVVAKIAPPMRIGEPPSYATIVQQADEAPACWSVRLQDRPVGWAASRVARRKDGISALESHVFLGDVGWEEMLPGWLSSVLRPVFTDLGPLDIDKKSRLDIDPLGRLVAFESRVRVAGLLDAIKVQGQVEGTTLKMLVQSGQFRDRIESFLPENALMSDELSPQTRLPGLRVGQTWTVPMYSPFRPGSDPLEVLQAEVEREDPLTWDGQTVNSRVIVYRPDAGSSLSDGAPRGRVWVRDDGLVLEQEVMVGRMRLRFVRLTDKEAGGILQALGSEWTAEVSNREARQVLKQLGGAGR